MFGFTPALMRVRSASAAARSRAAFKACLLGASMLTAPVIATSFVSSPVAAQSLPETNPDAELLLKADQLIYDNDAQIVTAIGDVQMVYDGYNVVAERVSYNQVTRRVKAFGNVEIIEPDGNKIFADEIDLTDDFSLGFVNALRIETTDDTIFTAESAERTAGELTTFNNGIYTACKACPGHPKKPPLWQIKARRVIANGLEKTIEYQDATFELFGQPIAYLPYFKHSDPSVKRKSGFLVPSIGYDNKLGFEYRQPYFLVTGETHDLTLAATGFTKQGVLGEARWRHRLENGSYDIRVAGIKQQRPEAFDSPPDSTEDYRGLVSTTGRFDINPRWAFGWNLLAQTDRNFGRTYDIEGASRRNQTNEIYLRGLNDRSYFDLSAYDFLIQNDLLTQNTAFQDEDQQAFVRPVLDYNYVTTEGFTGGELSLDFNVTSLTRDELNTATTRGSTDQRVHGFLGDTTRVSADLSWRNTFTTLNGLQITPSLSLRGDWINTDGTANGEPLSEGSDARFMPTAGLEVSYPILVRTDNSSHVFEPIAQLFVRPDLEFGGVVPNEDAQSLVFSASNLFQRDKFSGYDRIESGIRANLGLRYSGIIGNGWTLNGLVGQSIHLGGENPYAREDDLTNTGEESGLENHRSDYVASFGAIHSSGFSLNASGRFDENDLDMRRGEILGQYATSKFSVAASYAFIDAQPDAGFSEERQQIAGSANYNIDENWSIFGSARYDIENDYLVRNSVGITYKCDCFNMSVAYNESRSDISDEVNRSVSFKISLRTLGDFSGGFSDDDLRSFTDQTNE
jgi:LPS-assembly protein